MSRNQTITAGASSSDASPRSTSIVGENLRFPFDLDIFKSSVTTDTSTPAGSSSIRFWISNEPDVPAQQSSIGGGVREHSESLEVAVSTSDDKEPLHGRLRLGVSTDAVGRSPKTRPKPKSAAAAAAAAAVQVGEDSSVYVTRYVINDKIQTKKLCGEAAFETFVPFCNLSASRSPLGWIWSFVSSELFLYSIHLTAIAIGAFKEVMDLHETDPILELEHGIAESIATLSFIVIRMVNARMGYSMVLNTIGSVEHFDRQRDARLRTIQMWMWLFEIASGLLIVLCVTSFVLFYHFVHLGWTIMSNQFCLITSMVLSELYMARVTISVVKIREDQHKAVMYEALLLLQEFCLNDHEEHHHQATSDAVKTTSGVKDGRRETLAPVRTFVQAIANTGLFSPPPHINLSENCRNRNEMSRIDELKQFIDNDGDEFVHLRQYCQEFLDETLL